MKTDESLEGVFKRVPETSRHNNRDSESGRLSNSNVEGSLEVSSPHTTEQTPVFSRTCSMQNGTKSKSPKEYSSLKLGPNGYISQAMKISRAQKNLEDLFKTIPVEKKGKA